MATKNIETKAYITTIQWEQSRGDAPYVELNLDGYKGSGSFTSHMDTASILAFKRAYEKRLEIKITISFEQSDADEARDLLAAGNDKAAIGKALDILERLDK